MARVPSQPVTIIFRVHLPPPPTTRSRAVPQVKLPPLWSRPKQLSQVLLLQMNLDSDHRSQAARTRTRRRLRLRLQWRKTPKAIIESQRRTPPRLQRVLIFLRLAAPVVRPWGAVAPPLVGGIAARA